MDDSSVLLGQIVAAQGLKGEVKIYSYAEEPTRFEKIEKLYLGEKAKGSLGRDRRGTGGEEAPSLTTLEERRVEQVRYKGDIPLVKLAGTEDRTAAESLQFRYVYMAAADLPKLPEGEYYVRQLLGFDVVTEEGEDLGTLADILTDTPQKLYVVQKAEGGEQILIPGVDAFIVERNPVERKIIVRLPEGLLEL